jgi:hypothetical protein
MTDDEGMTKPEVTHSDEAPWLEDKIAMVRENGASPRVYNLEERTARFGETIIDFAKKIPKGPLTDRIINQLVGAGTSVGDRL